ncbi:putative glucan 1,3-beta-glucosidase A [Choanephora cucurbitarum]|uniref:glucan 1,3-beta-glucosidase n=1 Tax=Choanephora cucurbitarum TaxID=101091 RepID=A0A1C7NL19_9FUNG|nr:putative glucan 1,3-beta-glucosidase A [Choanephora cucurbitarum]
MVQYQLILIYIFYFCIIAVHSSPTEASGTDFNSWTTKAWGANLGNWLVLERWMNPSFFEKYAPHAKDEWTFSQQAPNASQLLKDHWDHWITEQDFKQLSIAKANHVRIPVGYWAFLKPNASEPYVSSGQKQQIERILSYCKKYKIYAILDLHGLPGSQNGNDHSGRIGKIEFYSQHNRERSLVALQAMVDWMNGLDNDIKSRISAIESANEPHVGSKEELALLKDYYQKAYKIISTSRYKVPMMFHDGFQGLDAWSGFLSSSANAIIDLHSYYAFPPEKDETNILKSICGIKRSAKAFHLPVFFGEWSLASGVNTTDRWLKKMMDTQISAYKNGGAGGTMWSIKNMIHSPEWSFELLQNSNIITNTTFSSYSTAAC